ncbi:unnamed protein product, partial [Lathyrus oleraceus]
MTRLTEKL